MEKIVKIKFELDSTEIKKKIRELQTMLENIEPASTTTVELEKSFTQMKCDVCNNVFNLWSCNSISCVGHFSCTECTKDLMKAQYFQGLL